MQVRILGPIGVVESGAEMPLSPQLGRLLGLLVVADGGYVSADRIAEHLADGDVDGSKIRTAVSRLRKVLGDRIETVPGGYRLQLAEGELDAARFESLRNDARTAALSERIGLSVEALGMWRGDALEGVADQEWATPAAARLESARAALTEDLADALSEAGRFGEAIELLDTHLVDHPYRERPIALLMRALAGAGRLPDALRAYQRFRVALRDDMGLDPSSELRVLEVELLAASDGEPERSAGGRGRNETESLPGDDGEQSDAVRPSGMSGAGTPPSGTLTFLFTDIEGSTRLWEEQPKPMRLAVERHDEILGEVIGSHGGYVFTRAGDAFAAAFARTDAAVAAAVGAQEALGAEVWPTPEAIRVRMGLHVGEAHERDGDYFGPPLNRAARIMAAANGGQIVASAAVVGIVGTDAMTDLGQHRLRDLVAAEHLWQVNGGAFPPLRSLDAARHNLPAERTPLIGRGDEVRQVSEQLARHRLVTLLGIGGSGKTRLATAVGAEVLDRFSDGVWFVDLVPASDRIEVVEAIAGATGLQIRGPDPVAGLIDVLASRSLLLVLDNCEHITDDAADVVDVLLGSTSQLRVLATGRVPLQLFDERQVQVRPLAVADDLDAPAVALFAASADRVGFRIDESRAKDAATICARLDGHPLSLQLAAAQLRHLSLAELAERLDQRLALLGQRRSDRTRRQASLRGVLEDTWSMLDQNEADLLLQLAAFPASFTIDDVESVAANLHTQAASSMAGLIDRGLVVPHPDRGHRLLETVKLFGRERWADQPDPGRYEANHTRWVLDALGGYSRSDQVTSYELIGWIDVHHEDQRLAENRLAGSERIDELVQLLAATGTYYGVCTAAQAAGVAERIDHYLATFPLDDRQRGLLSLVAANSGISTRNHGLIAERSADAVRLLRSNGAPEELSYALIANSLMAGFRDPARALANLEEAAEVANAAGAPAVADAATGYRLFALSLSGRIDDARAQLEELRRRLDGRPYDQAWNVYYHQLVAAHLLTEPSRAQRAVEDWSEHSAGTTTEVGTMLGKMLVYCLTAAANNDLDRTRELLADCQDLVERTTADDGLPDLLLPLVALAWARGSSDLARQWLTTIRHSRMPLINIPLSIHFRQLRDTIGLDTASDGDLASHYRNALDWLSTANSDAS